MKRSNDFRPLVFVIYFRNFLIKIIQTGHTVKEGKNFENEKSDKVSKQVLHKKMPKKCVCEHCDIYFCTKNGLKDHINAIHYRIKPYKCGKCEKSYTQKYKLTTHDRKIHQKLKKPFQCKICDAFFDRKYLLKLHEGTVHLNIVPHKCEICKKNFQQKADLRQGLLYNWNGN